jgi:predicted N-acyltransferase
VTITARRCASLDEVPAPVWDSVATSHNFYGTSEWLRPFEGPERNYVSSEPTYVVVTADGEAAAVAPCYLVRRTGRIPPHIDLHGNLFDGEKPVVTAEELDPYLVCGAPVGENRTLLRSGLSHADRASVLRRLVDEVKSLGEERHARVVAFGLRPASEAAELIAVDPTLAPAFGCFDCSLPLPGGGLDGYLSSLGRDRRKNVRQELRYFEEAGLRFERRRFSEVIDVAAPLMAASELKWGITLDVEWLKKAWRRMASVIDHRTRVFCVMKGEVLVSWTMAFLHGDTYYMRLSGTDEAAVPKRAAVYFNNGFYEPIRASVADGVRTIHYGSDSLPAKVGHGCIVTPLVYLLSWPASRAASPEVLAHLRDRSSTLIQEERAGLERTLEPARVESLLGLTQVRTFLDSGSWAPAA